MSSLRIKAALKTLAIIYLVYLALILLVCVPLLNLLAPGIYRAQTGRELHVDNILVNPFTLSVLVQNAASANPDGSPFWSFTTFVGDISLSSLWRGYPVLDKVQLSGLALQVTQTTPQRYNFSDILDYRAARAPTPKAAPTADNAPLRIAIGHLLLDVEHLGLRAPYRADPFDAKVQNLHLAVDDFTTVPTNPAPAAATAAAPAKTAPAAENTLPSLAMGRFDIGAGRIDFQSLRAQEPFATHWEDLHATLKNFSTTMQPGQPYDLALEDESGGRLRWQGDISLAARQSSGQLELRNISLLPVWRYFAPQLAFSAEQILLDAAGHYALNWGDALAYRIERGSVALRQVKLQDRTDAGTGVAWNSFSAAGIGVDSGQHRVDVAQVQLDGLALRGHNQDTRVSLIDMFKLPAAKADAEPAPAGPPWQVNVADITVRNSRVDWRASQLAVPALAVTPLDVHVANLHWPAAEPARLEFKAAVNDSVQLALNGELVPNGLTGKLSGELSGLPLSWGNTLLGEQMTATLANGKLGSRWQLTLDKGQPTTFRADGEIDQLELQRQSDRHKLLAWKRLQWHRLALDLPARRLAIDKIDLAAPWLEFRINADGTNNFQRLLRPQPAAPAATDSKPWQIAIASVRPANGTLNFRDNSMPRRFHANIGEFGGTINGLDSRRDKAARVDLKGSVDGYAPVTLTGTVNPFAAKPTLDLALDFNNLDLATLTPYSGTYAGYTIARGQLSVQLAYKLENSLIKGSNHIVVQQLQLGERVRSPKMIDLPLRLAIALLTDANGVMDLGVDISGNLDNPQFDLGGIIWKAFRNVIVKAVTAPFRLLGSLVSGGGDATQLGQVDFAAGSDEPGADDIAKLTKLKEALAQRPQLRLNISGHADPALDGAALRQRLLNKQLRDAGLSEEDIQEQSRSWRRQIEKLYEQHFPDRETGEQTPQQLADAVSGALPLPPGMLTSLAGRRALAIKRILVVQLGLPVDRVFIDAGGKKEEGAARVTMALDG
jgi:hypothetical protein